MAAVAALAMTTAACSGEEPGRPSTATSSSAAPSSAGQPSSAAPSADRPAVLALDDVLPCGLVDRATRAAWGIDRPEAPSAADPDAPVCTLSSTTTGGYLVALERKKGIDALGRPVNATVGGFPAVDIRQPGIKVGHLSIDVADGQRLDVEVQRLSGDQSVDEIYQDTMRFAEAVLAALRQQLGR